ncbi:MAG TPA: HEAT repeat domain-containing protein [Phycisphaerae bacterium]|nr:HEAT repeat domain-containing protein [Phycisphaerae bacterium]
MIRTERTLPEPLPDNLRPYLRTLAEELADIADRLWQLAEPIHNRQTEIDGHDNSRVHCEHVEQYLWKLIREPRREGDYRPVELFLLSCAACCHDFDKGLQSAVEGDPPHGEGSDQFVYDRKEWLTLRRPHADAIGRIISVHAKVGPDFTEALQQLPVNFTIESDTVDLQRLAVVLKAGDVLHCDNSRVPPLPVDPDKFTGLKRDKFLARQCTYGWEIDGRRVRLRACPESWEEKGAVIRCVQWMKENEWRPIADRLYHYRLPYELELDLDEKRIPIIVAAGAAAEISGEGRATIGMDYYHRGDAHLLAGRDEDIRILTRMVIGSAPDLRACVLVGPSGVGKSSVLHAGLAPAIECDDSWRCVITRPDRESGRFFTPADFGGVLGRSPAGDGPFANVCGQVLEHAGQLLVVLDQLEDIAYYGAFDAEALAGEMLDALAGREHLRLLLAYRDDVTSTIRPLENALAHSARGLPAHCLRHLDEGDARDAIRRLLDLLKLRLEPAEQFMDRIVGDLVLATRKEFPATAHAVYPPYIQMVVEGLASLAEGGVARLNAYNALGAGRTAPIDTMIGDYLTRNVEKLKEAGYDEAAAKRVLVCLSHSSGTKGRADEPRIAAEAGVPADALLRLLAEMANLRLVRRLGSGEWEVAHDLLARWVDEDLVGKAERRFKQAREALEWKARAYATAHGHLTREELRELWCRRQAIPPDSLSEEETLLILVSMFAPRAEELFADRAKPRFDLHFRLDRWDSPGWFWLRGSSCDELLALARRAAGASDPVARRCYVGLAALVGGSVDIPVLARIAREGPRLLSHSALEVFHSLAQPDDLPWLREALKDDHGDVRQAAAQAIGKLGSSADLPWLREALKDDDEYVRQAAAQAIGKLGSSPDLPWLRDALKDDHGDVRQAAAQAIGKLGSSADLPLLRDALKDEAWGARRAAAEAIAKLAWSADLPWLRDALKDKDEDVRRAAAEAIAKLGSSADLPWLRDALKDKDEDGRRAAAEAIAKLGSSADLPWLRDALKDEAWGARRAAAEAIAKLGSSADLPLLRDALKDKDEDVRRAAAEAIGKLGSSADLPLLRDALKDEVDDVRRAAAEAIGKLGSSADLPLLRDTLKDEAWGARRAAAEAIAKLATSADPPWLRDALKDKDEDVRRAAAEAIGKLAASADLPLLRDALKDEDPNVRLAAAEAISGALRNATDEQLLEVCMGTLLDTSGETSALAARIVGKRVAPEPIEALLDEHQEQMSMRALAMFDWFLYAPPYLRQAYEKRGPDEAEKKPSP